MTGISRLGQGKGLRPDSVTVWPADGRTHRRRVRTRRAVRRCLHTPRPMTVWACADDHHPAGTGLLAEWLHTAVVKIVTSYTRPGDRVLLLAPHAVVAEPTAGWPGTAPTSTVQTTAKARSQPGPLSGLHEAGWTVVRLGRDVVNWTITSDAVSPSATSSPTKVSTRGTTVESESGPGPGGDPTVGSPGRPESDLDSVGQPPLSPWTDAIGPAEARFNAIIATVDPSRTDWLNSLNWPTLLTPRGVLAVITYADTSEGRLVDPVGSVVTALRGRRMRYYDRVVLLGTPLSRITAHPDSRGADRRSALDALTRLGRDAAVSSSRAHADLLIFTHSAVVAPSSWTPTSPQEISDV
jgi:hypothetical protein